MEIEHTCDTTQCVGWDGAPIEVNAYGLPIIWTYDPPELSERPGVLQWFRTRGFKIFLLLAFGGTFVILLTSYLASVPDPGISLLGLKCEQNKQERALRRGYRRPPFFVAPSLLRLIAVEKSQLINWNFAVPYTYCNSYLIVFDVYCFFLLCGTRLRLRIRRQKCIIY